MFRPEFLNRIDETIVFRQLTRENIRAITSNLIRTVSARVENMGVRLSVTDEALDKLAEQGFDPIYGARPLRRTIQTAVEDRVAELLLEGTVKPGDTAEVRVEDGRLTVVKAA